MAAENNLGAPIPRTALFYISPFEEELRLQTLSPHQQHHMSHYRKSSYYIPGPYDILSSSCGFLLVRHRFFSYHIFDPLSDPLFGHTYLPSPPRAHSDTFPAVLAFSRNNPTLYTDYYVVCAIDEGEGCYSFDIFDSTTRSWASTLTQLDLHQGNIIRNTGVSVGRWVYWLTDPGPGEPLPVVVIHDPDHHYTHIVDHNIPMYAGPDTSLQLGRVRDDIGLVVVNGPLARLFFLNGDELWEEHTGETRLQIEGEDVVNDAEETVIVRFECSELEVVFSVGNRLFMWENFGNTVRFVMEMDEGMQIAVGMIDICPVPYISNPLLHDHPAQGNDH